MMDIPFRWLDFTGDYETHITTSYSPDLEDWARAHDVKYAHIVLDRGETSQQPMLTTRGRGTLEQQLARSDQLIEQLPDTVTVVRRKVEASPFNADVPRDAEEAAALPGTYFEHHLKLVLSGQDVEVLRTIVPPHGAHISRNARRELGGDVHERFITQRCYGVGRAAAGVALNKLLSTLISRDYMPIEIEREFVLVDDNPALDKGWINER